MKDNYTGYPSREGSGRYDMSYEEEMYNYRFYHDREFHVERIERDKKNRNSTLFGASLQVVVIGAFAVVVISHGKGLATETPNADALAADIIGTIWSIGLGITTLVELKNTITALKYIKIDINNKTNAFYARIKEDNLVALGSKNEELIEILTKLFEKPVFDFLKENQTN